MKHANAAARPRPGAERPSVVLLVSGTLRHINAFGGLTGVTNLPPVGSLSICFAPHRFYFGCGSSATQETPALDGGGAPQREGSAIMQPIEITYEGLCGAWECRDRRDRGERLPRSFPADPCLLGEPPPFILCLTSLRSTCLIVEIRLGVLTLAHAEHERARLTIKRSLPWPSDWEGSIVFKSR